MGIEIDDVREWSGAKRLTIYVVLLLFLVPLGSIRHDTYHSFRAFYYFASLFLHEMGHFVVQGWLYGLSWLLGREIYSEFWVAAGGTLFELILPIAIIIVYLRRRIPFMVGVFTAYLGICLINIAGYMASTLGPEVGGRHDWFVMFGYLNILHQGKTIINISSSCRWVGFLLFSAGSIFALFRFVTEALKPLKCAQHE